MPSLLLSFIISRCRDRVGLVNRSLKFIAVMVVLCAAAAEARTSTGSIHGTVTSEGSPLTGAVVTLLELNRSCLTDQLGKFEFTTVPGGKYVLFVRMLGYENSSREITVGNDAVTADFP